MTSGNWAGYDAVGLGFTSVTATWIQPTVKTYVSGDADSYFWVGFDGGDGSPIVEQIGTEAGYIEGDGVDSFCDAWYEMTPNQAVLTGLKFKPGDRITATATTNGLGYVDCLGYFTLTITDDTTGASFTTGDLYSLVALDESAEIAVEAPARLDGDQFPLSEFGSVSFTDCAINGSPIAASDWNQIDMVGPDGATLATTSALSADGSGFTVTNNDTTTPVTTVSGGPGVVAPIACQADFHGHRCRRSRSELHRVFHR